MRSFVPVHSDGAGPAGGRIHHQQRRQAPASRPGSVPPPVLWLPGRHHHELAAVVEFIHTATSCTTTWSTNPSCAAARDTANAMFGNAASVLVGDFLYSRPSR